MKKSLALAATIVVTATSAFSQVGFSNGGVQLTYGSFSFANDSRTFSAVTVDAFGIFTISPSFDVQAGLSYNDLEYIPTSTYSDFGYNLHAIYNLSGGSRVGAFYSSTSMWEASDINTFGVEYQYSSGPISVEVQAGATEIYEGDAVFVVANAEYAYGDFTFGAGLSYVVDDFFSYNIVSVNAGYTISSFYNAEIFAEIGYVSSKYDPNLLKSLEIGLKIPFGAGSQKAFGDTNNFMRDVHLYID